MARGSLCAAILFALSAVGLAIINPRFTPRHLVEEADLVAAGPIQPTAKPLEWQFAAAVQVKGTAAARHVLSLRDCSQDHVGDIRKALAANGEEPAIVFSATINGAKLAFLHVAGLWLNVKAAGDARWSVTGYAPHMTGVYTGGTDMLIRMCRHLVEDRDATVPVTAGVRWLALARAGNVPGDIAGLAAIEFPALHKACLFVGGPAGDRLFRARDDDTLEEITAAAGLDTKSRRFAWLDIDGDGLADLLSWDGTAAAVRLACADGTFKPAALAPSVGPACRALAPCSTDGRPGVLVSAPAPFLVVADAKGEWRRVELPPGVRGGGGQASAGVVADIDNDGFADILQPSETAGILWRGRPGGFLPPQPSPVATGGGTADAAVGDFNQDGFLDIFLAGAEKNTLWENDGKGGFRDVFGRSGSLSTKCPPRAAAVAAMDLNHDGRQDICLGYAAGEPLYHWNRGFRSFGEEGEVRIAGTPGSVVQARPGLRALLAADLNADGSSDLAAVLANGDLIVCFNEQVSVPGVRLRLSRGVTGPATASLWVGDRHPVCLGALAVPGHSPAVTLSTRAPGKCTVRFHLPGRPNQSATLAVEDAPKDLILKETER